MGGRGASSSGSTSRESFIRDIVKNYDDFTRGDLQGAVEAYVMKKGMTPKEVNIASEKLLSEIDDRRTAQRSEEQIKRMKSRGVKVVNEVPKGYVKTEGATTAPKGYTWYSNNKSYFSGERKAVLVKDKKKK